MHRRRPAVAGWPAQELEARLELSAFSALARGNGDVVVGNQIVHRDRQGRLGNYAIWLAPPAARALHDQPSNQQPMERIATMQDLHPAQLTTVVGGTTKNDQITQQITALQSSIKDAVTASTSNGGGNNQTFMMLAMMMALRPGPTVVAAGGPPPVAAPSSVVNIRTRVRG